MVVQSAKKNFQPLESALDVAGDRMKVKKYRSDLKHIWDNCVKRSSNGSLFHEQKFLSYHQKLKTVKYDFMFYEKEKLIGVMPLSVDLKRGLRRAYSPYGGSFGGIVYNIEEIGYKGVEKLYNALFKKLTALGVDELHLTLTPAFYNRIFEESQRLVIQSNTSNICFPQLTNIIEIDKLSGLLLDNFTYKLRKNIRQSYKKYKIREGGIDEFYPILLDNMAYHKAKPTHSMKDLLRIKNLYPDKIIIDLATYKNTPIAGCLYLEVTKDVLMLFYCSQLTEYRRHMTIEPLIYERIIKSKLEGPFYKIIDYGTSSHKNSLLEVNYSLNEFKEKMRFYGAIRDNYIIGKW